jgi:predicted pyridoxine 5'-phosphate oxidase superfamily flavin-nucleotide-binding protein
MSYRFLDIARTPSVRAGQEENGGAQFWSEFKGNRQFHRRTEIEAHLIEQRDSFDIATVSENGWPYVQHRRGPTVFLRVVYVKTLVFADFRGNRQYVSLSNLGADSRAALILMDYPNRRRLKICGHVEPKDLAANPELATKLAMLGYKAKPVRARVLHVQAFHWNCPQQNLAVQRGRTGVPVRLGAPAPRRARKRKQTLREKLEAKGE